MPLPQPGRIRVAPSLLAADFTRLGEEIRRAEDGGADVLHLDIMDGHFVPNLTMGPPLVEAIRKISKLPFDVHLMLTNPENFVTPFIAAGADNITIHTEIAGPIGAILDDIHKSGCSAGLSVRPKTPGEAVFPFLKQVDLILVMTVEPGFGGQSFMADMVPKIATIRKAIDTGRRPIHLEVDGGIAMSTVRKVTDVGADLLVAGTSVFRAKEGIGPAIAALRG